MGLNRAAYYSELICVLLQGLSPCYTSMQWGMSPPVLRVLDWDGSIWRGGRVKRWILELLPKLIEAKRTARNCLKKIFISDQYYELKAEEERTILPSFKLDFKVRIVSRWDWGKLEARMYAGVRTGVTNLLIPRPQLLRIPGKQSCLGQVMPPPG